MPQTHPSSTARIAGHPVHPMLVPFPIAALVGALASDIVYWQGGDLFWATASFYLLAVGIVTALAAAVAGFTDFMGDRRIRGLGVAWGHLIGNLVVVGLSVANLLVRLGDPAGAIVPLGLGLSAAAGLLLFLTGWLGGELVFRHGVAVVDEGPRQA